VFFLVSHGLIGTLAFVISCTNWFNVIPGRLNEFDKSTGENEPLATTVVVSGIPQDLAFDGSSTLAYSENGPAARSTPPIPFNGRTPRTPDINTIQAENFSNRKLHHMFAISPINLRIMRWDHHSSPAITGSNN
jgi:hypothetical protein